MYIFYFVVKGTVALRWDCGRAKYLGTLIIYNRIFFVQFEVNTGLRVWTQCWIPHGFFNATSKMKPKRGVDNVQMVTQIYEILCWIIIYQRIKSFDRKHSYDVLYYWNLNWWQYPWIIKIITRGIYLTLYSNHPVTYIYVSLKL